MIQEFPIATAIIDLNLKIKHYSKIWLKEFPTNNSTENSDVYFNDIPTIPEKVRSSVKSILSENSVFKKTLETKDENSIWFEWKLNGIKDKNNKITEVIIVAENITKSKKKEELLLKVESVSNIGAWEVDILTNNIFWTDTTKKIHEVPLSYTPTLEGGINFYKEGENRTKITNIVTEAMSNGTPWDEELQITTSTGKDLWVRAKGEAELIDNKCVRIFGTFQDIDNKKKEQIKFKEISDRLAIATSSSKIGIWEYDLFNEKLIWDDSMFEIYDVKKGSIKDINDYWIKSLHPDDKERYLRERRSATTNSKGFDSEFRILWPNGEVRYIKTNFTLQKDKKGNPNRLIGTNWDITELKKTQLKLTKNEESFKGVFENSAIGMALVGLDGSWLDVNDSICNSLGYTKEELLQSNFQEITHKDDLKSNLNHLSKILKGTTKDYQVEKKYIHKNGSIVNAIVTITPIKDYQEKTTHILAQIIDITSRITAENETKNLISITKTQNRSLLNFAHIVSHNLRSHSTNLSMLTTFLNEEEDKTEKKEIENMLIDASESLNESVHHLNDVVQITTTIKEKIKEVNIFNSIKRVRKNISVLLKEKGTICNIDMPIDLIIVAVPAYLDSILLNLFTNAVKYSANDKTLEINIKHKIKDNKTVIYFSDNGLGIDLKRHGKKLFGMYKTFHKHEDSKGIGLFITKNQIEAMNGEIKVKSEVGVGTTFILTFMNQKTI
ncbi:PAS domain-containing protein [Cellulophaga sp. HaHaR_3_176]|uniref:sensor histidine kinase n=1 Tax=Cellulophaga sp. HaHaR_3_176 TaxID=1942464 RepID=UPI001C1F363E|nr:HAMP domain-containing sensor histidine kinase [Cellulophaga sp. HaHaR_3_176]QWX83374.1 PAS domain-containing protein [Cellulophaga sp. HaHaR_3_176]